MDNMGRPAYISKDKEVFFIATKEMESAHGLPKYVVTASIDFQNMFHTFGI